jgi:hypothetical protein
LDLVGTHVVMAGQVFGFSEGGRIPKPGMDAGDGPSGGGELRPGQTHQLVPVPAVPNELQQQDAVGPMEGGGTRKQARGQFPFERDEETIGGEFPIKNAEFPGPFSPLGDVASDLQDVGAGIAFPSGDQDLAEEAGGSVQGVDQETERPGGKCHG